MKKFLRIFSIAVFAGCVLFAAEARAVNFDTVNITGALQLGGSQIIGTSTAYMAVANGGTGSNTAAGARTNLGFVSGVTAVTGSVTVATGLTTVSIAVPALTALVADVGGIIGTTTGAPAGSIVINVFGVGTTTLSTTATNAGYIAIGTP